jgi:hypothetical protein
MLRVTSVQDPVSSAYLYIEKGTPALLQFDNEHAAKIKDRMSDNVLYKTLQGYIYKKKYLILVPTFQDWVFSITDRNGHYQYKYKMREYPLLAKPIDWVPLDFEALFI